MNNIYKKRKFVVYGLVCPIERIIRYIGISCNPKSRKKAHASEKGNSYKKAWIQKCIRTTGQAPSFRVLRKNLSFKEACKLEKCLIKSRRKKIGKKLTNLTDGGEGRQNYKHKEETKLKIGQAQIGNKNHMYGKKISLERKKMVSKSVCQYDKDGNLINEFYSVVEAKRQTNIDDSVIIKCCKGKQGTAGDFIWRYKEDSFEKYNWKSFKSYKAVIQLDLNGNEIRRFSSVTESAWATKCDLSGIASCCRGLVKSIGGFRWCYA